MSASENFFYFQKRVTTLSKVADFCESGPLIYTYRYQGHSSFSGFFSPQLYLKSENNTPVILFQHFE